MDDETEVSGVDEEEEGEEEADAIEEEDAEGRGFDKGAEEEVKELFDRDGEDDDGQRVGPRVDGKRVGLRVDGDIVGFGVQERAACKHCKIVHLQ